MRALSQIVVVTLVNLKSLRQRLGPSLVAVVGIAGVVAITVAVLSIAEGFRATMESTGSRDTALVMRSGTDTEMNSIITRDDARAVADAPGVRQTDDGAAASAELFVVVDVPKRSTGSSANVPLRGVEPAAFDVRSNFRLVEGRRFELGKRELIVGRGAQRAFRGLDVGSTLRWGENDWIVVGTFTDGGSVAESEIWTDARVLMPTYRRTVFQSVVARLESPEAFDDFKAALTTDPRLNVKVMRETDYYAEQSDTLTTLITILGLVVGTIMSGAAIFGAFNTMYTAVSSRSREIATLRALGFKGLPVVVSVLAESMVLGLVGGVLGGLAAYAVFNGYQASTLNFQSFSQVAFAFAVTPRLLVQGIVAALTIGFVGGLLPAWRAARLPIATALREL